MRNVETSERSPRNWRHDRPCARETKHTIHPLGRPPYTLARELVEALSKLPPIEEVVKKLRKLQEVSRETMEMEFRAVGNTQRLINETRD